MTTVTDPAGPLPPADVSAVTMAGAQADVSAVTMAGAQAGVSAVTMAGAPARVSAVTTAAPSYYPYYVPAPPGRFVGWLLRLWERSPRWLAPAAVLACFAGAAGYVLVSDPTDGAANAPTTCLVKLTTGYDCPGCGGTRAFFYLLHGNLPAAARHHLLFVFAVPFLVYLYVAWAGQRMFRWRLPELRLPSTALGIFLAAWFVFSVLRNLPWAPFTWFYV